MKPPPVTITVVEVPAVAIEGAIEVIDGGGTIVSSTEEGDALFRVLVAVTVTFSGVTVDGGAVYTSPASVPQSVAEHFRLTDTVEGKTFSAVLVRVAVCPGSRVVGLAKSVRLPVFMLTIDVVVPHPQIGISIRASNVTNNIQNRRK